MSLACRTGGARALPGGVLPEAGCVGQHGRPLLDGSAIELGEVAFDDLPRPPVTRGVVGREHQHVVGRPEPAHSRIQ